MSSLFLYEEIRSGKDLRVMNLLEKPLIGSARFLIGGVLIGARALLDVDLTWFG